MNTNRLTYGIKVLAVAMSGLCYLSSCSNEPDGKDLYTATGLTISDYILQDEDLSSFEYILERVSMDKKLSTYGKYTCFAPSNQGVTEYIDSLWNDEEARIPHNGLTENSLEGLTDSLCREIARYHLVDSKGWTVLDLAQSSGSISTMLGYPITTGIADDGSTLLNKSRIISADNEAVNGVFHKIDAVIARSSRLICDEFAHVEGYSIFYEALMLTGMDKELIGVDKGIKYTINDDWDVSSAGQRTDRLYHPEECKLGYTIFAESDEVLSKNNINSIGDLINYAKEQYADCSDWYDYVAEKNIEIAPVIPVKGHTLVEHKKVEPSCKEMGTEAYWECTRCHKLFSDEKGTKAGAATMVIMNATALPTIKEPPKVYLDRPFVFMLIDTESNVPFFIGTVMDVE